MTDIDERMLDRELKKGSAELMVLALLEGRPRHGYEISKLIEQRSQGTVKFHIASLYPLLYRLEQRGWIAGKWVEKAGERRRRFYRLTPEGAASCGRSVRRGKPSWPRLAASPEENMPDRSTGSGSRNFVSGCKALP